MKLNAKDHFNEGGFNIFGAVKIKDLPADLKDHLRTFLDSIDEEDHFCLVGSGGRLLWEKLTKEEKSRTDFIDNASLKIVKDLDPEAIVLYPHQSKHFPLQQAGRFFNLSSPSSLGLDISPEFGPWFSYRCAFVTKITIGPFSAGPHLSACLSCADRACIDHCPAGAVSPMKFNSKKCIDQRLKTSTCIDTCGARSHCSFHPEKSYEVCQLSYHMLQSLRWLKEFIKIDPKNPEDL